MMNIDPLTKLDSSRSLDREGDRHREGAPPESARQLGLAAALGSIMLSVKADPAAPSRLKG